VDFPSRSPSMTCAEMWSWRLPTKRISFFSAKDNPIQDSKVSVSAEKPKMPSGKRLQRLNIDIPPEDELEDMELSRLKRICRANALKTAGSRSELLKRLSEARELLGVIEHGDSIQDDTEVSSIEEDEEIEEQSPTEADLYADILAGDELAVEEGVYENFDDLIQNLEAPMTIEKDEMQQSEDDNTDDTPDFFVVSTAPQAEPRQLDVVENVEGIGEVTKKSEKAQEKDKSKATKGAVVEAVPVSKPRRRVQKDVWESLGISKESLIDGLDRLEISLPNKLQSKAMPRIAEGNDFILASATGSGKTLTFLLPVLSEMLSKDEVNVESIENEMKSTKSSKKFVTPEMLVLVPGQELARQVSDVASTLLPQRKGGPPCMYLTGGDDKARQAAIMLRRRPRILVGTPARVLEAVKAGLVRLDDVKNIVLDEADIILREPILSGKGGSPQLPIGKPGVRTLLSSASAADKAVLDFAQRRLREGWQTFGMSEQDIGRTFVSPTITHTYYTIPSPVSQRRSGRGRSARSRGGRGEWDYSNAKRSAFEEKDFRGGTRGRGSVDEAKLRRMGPLDRKLAAAKKLFLEDEPSGVLMFVNGPGSVKDVVSKLHELGIWWALPLSGSMDTDERSRVMKRLAKESRGDLDTSIPGEVLVATDVASRGLDPPLLSHVINVDIPRNSKSYAHRAGRCGRAGRPGLVVSLVGNRTEEIACQELAREVGVDLMKIEI